MNQNGRYDYLDDEYEMPSKEKIAPRKKNSPVSNRMVMLKRAECAINRYLKKGRS